MLATGSFASPTVSITRELTRRTTDGLPPIRRIRSRPFGPSPGDKLAVADPEHAQAPIPGARSGQVTPGAFLHRVPLAILPDSSRNTRHSRDSPVGSGLRGAPLAHPPPRGSTCLRRTRGRRPLVGFLAKTQLDPNSACGILLRSYCYPLQPCASYRYLRRCAACSANCKAIFRASFTGIFQSRCNDYFISITRAKIDI